MAKHSTTVGGSNAGRVLACPASVQTILALPESVDISSSYAEEGTHLHHVSDALMRARQADNDIDLYALAESYVGTHFYDRIFSTDLLKAAIWPALDQLAILEKEYGGGFVVVGVEKNVRFPGIPGAFGTGDLLLKSATHLILNDWKYGSGVPVKAVYVTEDGSGEYVNPQLMFYLTATRHSARHLFKSNKILVGAITQPRTEEPLTHTIIERKELTYFQQDLEAAMVEAFGRNARRVKGEWCRWAPCKISCPLWTGPLLDLSAIKGVPAVAANPKIKAVTPYGEYLAHAKRLLDMAIVLKPTIDEQIHSFLDAGGIVPGWKLKQKSKNRAWIDEAIVAPALKKLGFKVDEIWQKKLQTFTSVDATAKQLGVEIPTHLRVAPPTNETTIASEGDPAPAIDRATALTNFQGALAKLTKAS